MKMNQHSGGDDGSGNSDTDDGDGDGGVVFPTWKALESQEAKLWVITVRKKNL